MQTIIKAVTTAIVLSAAASASAQCTKDTDCKGDRVCEGGTCVYLASLDQGNAADPNYVGSLDSPSSQTSHQSANVAQPTAPQAPSSSPGPQAPTASPAQAAQTPAAASVAVGTTAQPADSGQWYNHYFSVATMKGFGGSGEVEWKYDGYSKKADLELDDSRGIYFSLFWVTNSVLHLGSFLSYAPNEMKDTGAVATGASMKLGGRLGRNFFLSGVLDAGYHFMEDEQETAARGMVLGARIQLDWMLSRGNGTKWGLFAALGNRAVISESDEIEGEDGSYHSSLWFNRTTLMLGGTFGR